MYANGEFALELDIISVHTKQQDNKFKPQKWSLQRGGLFLKVT